MAYQALYRKFRPSTFGHVIGQDHIVRTLKNQMLSGRVSHAYLFCGTRGTGKTSTAKIFAKSINCMSLTQGEPCNECEMCKAIASGRSMNVVEIDAASNNGVDNIREIREEVKYPPTEGKYKVYIIDEVHMLSQGAFNALLKTLEEPPAHVIFILATTDPQKVPVTIHSRCQRFDFRRITANDIVETLKKYLEEENTVVQEKALQYIARLADGSMRDSLSILDQCMAFYYKEEITLEKVLDVVGSVDNSIFFYAVDALHKKNASKLMEIVEEIMIQGRDVGQFVIELIVHLRNLLVVLTVEKSDTVLDLSIESIEELLKQSSKMTPDELIYYIKVFSKLSGELKYASNERVLLEVALIRLCSPESGEEYDALAARISKMEKKLQDGFSIATLPQSQLQIQKDKVLEEPKIARPKAMSEDSDQVAKLFEEIKKELDPVTKALVANGHIMQMENDRLTLVCDNAAVEGALKKKLDVIKQKIESGLEKEIEITTVTKMQYDEWETASGKREEIDSQDLDFQSLIHGILPEAEIE